MFRPLIVKTFHNSTPFFPILVHSGHENQIFLLSPFLMFDRSIKMVQPSLSALFAVSEKQTIGVDVQLNSYLVPSWFFSLGLDYFHQQLIFFFLPFSFQCIFIDSKIFRFILQYWLRFIRKCLFQFKPLFLILKIK